MKRPVILAAILIAITAVAFITVGLAYTASVENSDNTTPVEYVVLSQSEFTFNQNGLRLDTLGGDVGTAYIVNYAEPLMGKNDKKFQIDSVDYHGYAVGTDTLKVTSVGNAVTSPIKVSLCTFGTGFKDFSEDYLGWRYVMKIEGKDNDNGDLLWYACYDGRPPAVGSEDGLVGWKVFKDMGTEWEEVSHLDVHFGAGIDDYKTTLYIAGPGETIRDGSMLKAAEESVKATGDTSVKAVWIAKTDSDHKITIRSGSESYEFYGWIKSDSQENSMKVYEEGKESEYIEPEGEILSGGDYYAVYKISDVPSYKETYYEWTGKQYEWTATNDNDGKADRYKNIFHIDLPEDGSVIVYYFVGWYESTEPPSFPEGHSATAYIAPGTNVSMTSNHTYYAMYYATKSSTYTETYWEWNGTEYSNVSTRENDGVADRANKEQFSIGDVTYTFKGWKETGAAPVDPLGEPDRLPGESVSLESDHVFYALYQKAEEAAPIETYYEWNGVGTVYESSNTLTYVTINDGIVDLQRVATITIEGVVYAFRGWVATEPSSVTDGSLPRIAPDTEIDRTMDVSYYAVYIQVAMSFTESYYEWNGTEYSVSVTSIGDGLTDAPWTEKILNSDNTAAYTFSGWYKPDQNAIPTTTPKEYNLLSQTELQTFVQKGNEITVGNHEYYAVYTKISPNPTATYHEWGDSGYSVKNISEAGSGKAETATEGHIQASISKNEKAIYIPGSTYVLPDKEILSDTDQPTGKGFIGWSYNGKTYMPGQRLTQINGDIEITAVWGSEVTIKYSAGIGKGTKNDDSVLPGTLWELPDGSSDFRYYEGGTAPADPDNDDMFFLGWAAIIGNNDPVYYKAGEIIKVTYSMILEAQYGFKIKFSSGHESATGSMDPIIVKPGAPFILPNVKYTLAGHAPHHWMHDSHKGNMDHVEYYSPGDQLISTMNIELIVQWATEYYTISFDANGGTGTMESKPSLKGSRYVLPLSDFTPPASSYLAGWTVGEMDYSVGETITIDGDTEIKARWEQTEKVVIRYDNSNMADVTGDAVQFELADGASFILDNCGFTKTGYGFSKWQIGTTQYDPGTKIDSKANDMVTVVDGVNTITIQPVFSNTGLHTLTFKSDYGLNRPYILNEGASFILPNIHYTRANHLSHEWVCEKKSGDYASTEYHSPGDVITVQNNTDVMVEWEEILVSNRAYTIQFDRNYPGEGSGTMDDVTVAPGSAYVLPVCGFKRTGYMFDKWMIANEEYSPGSVINAVRDTTTVKALWKESVTVTTDYGCGNEPVSETMKTGTWFRVPVNNELRTGGPADEDFGWLFKGWLVTVGDKWNTDTRYVAMSFISPVDSTGERDGYMIKDGTVKFIYDVNDQQDP
jgi:hypothetical protein